MSKFCNCTGPPWPALPVKTITGGKRDGAATLIRALCATIVLVALTACAAPVPTATTTPTPTPVVATPGSGSANLPAYGSIIIPAPASDDPTVESPRLRLKISVVDEYTKQPINADVIRVDEFTERDVQWVEISGLDGTITHTVAITATGYRYVEFELRPRIKRHKFIELNIPLELLRDTGRSPHVLAMISPLPTPTPETPWWTWPCNTPPVQYPDGCPDLTPIERPPAPIAPPCIHTAYTEMVPNDDDPALLDTHLVIVVDHPEQPRPQRQTVRIVQPASPPLGRSPVGANATTGGTEGGRGRQWQADYYGDWEYKCGRDEAPLAWATREALNTHSLAPLASAYAQPLPDPFVALLGSLTAAPIDYRTRPYPVYLPTVLSKLTRPKGVPIYQSTNLPIYQARRKSK